MESVGILPDVSWRCVCGGDNSTLGSPSGATVWSLLIFFQTLYGGVSLSRGCLYSRESQRRQGVESVGILPDVSWRCVCGGDNSTLGSPSGATVWSLLIFFQTLYGGVSLSGENSTVGSLSGAKVWSLLISLPDILWQCVSLWRKFYCWKSQRRQGVESVDIPAKHFMAVSLLVEDLGTLGSLSGAQVWRLLICCQTVHGGVSLSGDNSTLGSPSGAKVWSLLISLPDISWRCVC